MHNGMGHSATTSTRKAANSKGRATTGHAGPLRRRALPWRFADTDDLAEFCRSLFGLLAVDDESLLKALDAQVGINTDAAGVSLEWELLYLQQYRKQIDA